MCVGSKPKAPAPDPAVEAQQAEQKAQETQQKATRRQESLQQTVARRTGGRGRRSLISGTGGGMGFYNEYL